MIGVFRQKNRVSQQMTGTKSRKMTLQLLGVSCLLIFTNLGLNIIQVGQL